MSPTSNELTRLHSLPQDFKMALTSNNTVYALWKSFTPLAQNEWICWVTSAKKYETRKRRISVGVDKINNGMRRPCCWAGCPHR